MKVTITGIFSITSGDVTMIVCRGNVPQSYPLPDARDVAIAPTLADSGLSASAGFLHFQTGMTVKMTESKVFSRIEIVPMSEADRKIFYATMVLEPEAAKALENIKKIIDALPDDGEASKLFKTLEGLNLRGTLKELLITIKNTMPEKWPELKSELLEIGVNADEMIA